MMLTVAQPVTAPTGTSTQGPAACCASASARRNEVFDIGWLMALASGSAGGSKQFLSPDHAGFQINSGGFKYQIRIVRAS